MGWVFREKLPRLVLAAYLVVCVIGVFSFAVSDSLFSSDFVAENLIPERIFDSLGNYFVQHPAEEPVSINKLGNTQFSPLRVIFQRTAFLFGSFNIGNSFSKSLFKANIKIRHTNSKDNILLKLRI
jgi:hypothetical protein